MSDKKSHETAKNMPGAPHHLKGSGKRITEIEKQSEKKIHQDLEGTKIANKPLSHKEHPQVGAVRTNPFLSLVLFPPICTAISSQRNAPSAECKKQITQIRKTLPTERDGSDTDPDIGIHCHDISRRSLQQDHSWGPRKSHIAVWAQANKT